jgi:hypothetical protein
MSEVSARLYEDQTPQQARALTDAYRAGIDGRAAAAIRAVRDRDGPADRLDFTPDSLVPLWGWFLETFSLPAEPVADDIMRASDPPWWYDFHPGLGRQLGPEIARVMTDIVAYVVKVAQARLPGTEVVLGGGGRRSVSYQVPLIRVPRYGDIELDTGVVIMTLRAFRHESRSDRPEILKEMVESWDIPAAADDSPESSSATFDVVAIDDPRFSHRVSIDEVVAVDEETRIEETVRRLSASTGIDAVVHEDREVLLIRAPGMATDELAQLVETTWASTHA